MMSSEMICQCSQFLKILNFRDEAAVLLLALVLEPVLFAPLLGLLPFAPLLFWPFGVVLILVVPSLLLVLRWLELRGWCFGYAGVLLR
jgi:hypothetical protein